MTSAFCNEQDTPIFCDHPFGICTSEDSPPWPWTAQTIYFIHFSSSPFSASRYDYFFPTSNLCASFSGACEIIFGNQTCFLDVISNSLTKSLLDNIKLNWEVRLRAKAWSRKGFRLDITIVRYIFDIHQVSLQDIHPIVHSSYLSQFSVSVATIFRTFGRFSRLSRISSRNYLLLNRCMDRRTSNRFTIEIQAPSIKMCLGYPQNWLTCFSKNLITPQLLNKSVLMFSASKITYLFHPGVSFKWLPKSIKQVWDSPLTGILSCEQSVPMG